MNAEEQIRDLIAISCRLMKLLKRENEVLRTEKPSDLTALAHEKDILTRAFEVRTNELKDLSGELDDVEDSLRRQLQDIGQDVHTLVEENACFLKAGMEANRCVVEAVAEAIQIQRPGPGTYNAAGELGPSGAGVKNKPSSLTFNQSL